MDGQILITFNCSLNVFPSIKLKVDQMKPWLWFFPVTVTKDVVWYIPLIPSSSFKDKQCCSITMTSPSNGNIFFQLPSETDGSLIITESVTTGLCMRESTCCSGGSGGFWRTWTRPAPRSHWPSRPRPVPAARSRVCCNLWGGEK